MLTYQHIYAYTRTAILQWLLFVGAVVLDQRFVDKYVHAHLYLCICAYILITIAGFRQGYVNKLIFTQID